MSGFDDYWNEWCIASNCEEGECRKHFEAGAQSRQAEIDELQAMYEKQGLYAFELQKRIDELMPLLERYNYAGWAKILKGNQNE